MSAGDSAIVQLSKAQSALAECKTVMEAKQIADVAEAARVYLERTNASAETVNRATEIRLLAERQMGEFLKAMPKNTGTAGQLVGPGRIGATHSEVPTLAQVGITHHESSRAQKLAEIPAEEFRERVAVAKASGGKLSTSKIINPAPTRRAPQKFNLAEWKRHTATMLDLRFRGAPDDSVKEAIDYVNSFVARYDQPHAVEHDGSVRRMSKTEEQDDYAPPASARGDSAARPSRGHSLARVIWGGVKPRLDAISKNDPELNEVMREISEYALSRVLRTREVGDLT